MHPFPPGSGAVLPPVFVIIGAVMALLLLTIPFWAL